MSIDQEYRAARDGCALYAVDSRRVITATGEDRVVFLHGMLSNDVKALRPGFGVDAALLTQQGKIVSDVRVYADADRLMLDVPGSRAEAVVAALEKFIVADDVELSVNESEQPLLGIVGPKCTATIAAALDMELPARVLSAHRPYVTAAKTYRLVARDEIDDGGYTIWGSPGDAQSVREKLQQVGAVAIGRETVNVLRIEAGIPCYGVDMDDENLLMETNLDRAVSFTKGCYLGQEVVERVAARGKVNKKLSGLTVAGNDVPPAGTLLRSGGKDVGHITSAVRSPALNEIIALGYVHRDFLEPGTTLQALVGTSERSTTVSTLPFVSCRVPGP